MELKRLRLRALEDFRVINGMNPQYIQNIFTRDSKSKVRENGLVIPTRKTVTYGGKRIGALCPHIWHILPHIIKSSISPLQFKNILKM